MFSKAELVSCQWITFLTMVAKITLERVFATIKMQECVEILIDMEKIAPFKKIALCAEGELREIDIQ